MADWDKILSRGQVEDRRGMAGGLGGVGLVGTIIILGLMFFSNPDPATLNQILGQLQNQVAQQGLTSEEFQGADSYETFASTVLGSANDVWKGYFQQNNKSYTEPTLILFRGGTASGCGLATSSVGPHYCPIDKAIYLDETFFDELQNRFGARGGDVAEAYVIAHEVGHHVQNELGILDKVHSSQGTAEANELSIKAELQADCFAGVWAHAVARQGVFEKDEILEALDAAAAVGDDRIQEKIQGRINPESWTHGSSEQRVEWFSKGYDSGKPSDCNTFN
jgi:predicted metalloprotease